MKVLAQSLRRRAQVKEVQRLRELEKENGRLKRLLAERVLVEYGFAVSELDIVKEALSKNW